ncbi:hypothetical protein BRO54_1459 [Geobacillus proteiniphilus]|uniref:Uncharacterized protein n=1 Tax=Geobacillus proteiniphilus TaxID=860353 RepID=A0A1Q5T3E8_9BACL|nr:hypothetical protein BRO54_1459 [Geobacillus proteiniphilus]
MRLQKNMFVYKNFTYRPHSVNDRFVCSYIEETSIFRCQ